jgi:hypothetical protein
MTKHTHHTRVRAFGLGSLVIGVILAVTGLTASPASAAVNDHQIEICHATSSETNPYTTPTPNKWQITAPNGHGTLHADDIIPPFLAGSHGGHSWDDYPGKNWTEENEQVWENGCNDVPPAIGSITLDKVTAGDGQPADTTAFGFSIVCTGEATVPDASPALAPADPATAVATDVAVETTCTIGEDAVTDAGLVSTMFSVDEGPEVEGPVTVEMTNAEQVISIVVTNTYACVAPSVPDGEGACVPPVVVNDACPTVDGVQTDTSLCPPIVENTVVTQSVVATTVPTQVAGIQVVRAAELPRTGSGTARAALLGVGFLLLGAGALLVGREQTSTA